MYNVYILTPQHMYMYTVNPTICLLGKYVQPHTQSLLDQFNGNKVMKMRLPRHDKSLVKQRWAGDSVAYTEASKIKCDTLKEKFLPNLSKQKVFSCNITFITNLKLHH